MTQKIYRPAGSGTEFQLKVGSDWKPVYGIAGITISGGDRETTTFETLDGGIESSVGAAGVKDINLTLNPSFFNAFHNKIVAESFYGNDQVTVRFRTPAESNVVAAGGSGEGIKYSAIAAGYGNEGAITWQVNTGNAKTAQDAIQETAEMGLLVTSNAPKGSDRTDSEPAAGTYFIVRYDGTNYAISDWGGKAVGAESSNTEHWQLLRHGVAFEFTCRVTTGGNPDMSPGAPIGDTLNLQQVAAGFKKYPILKAA